MLTTAVFGNYLKKIKTRLNIDAGWMPQEVASVGEGEEGAWHWAAFIGSPCGGGNLIKICVLNIMGGASMIRSIYS